ncbi:S49 family peptidase [Bartonella sp. CB175]|uniref:S49 family peptidase n=1 Tax=Bartonella sp. CB175 TaxID=3112256 RepID=UPI00300E251C
MIDVPHLYQMLFNHPLMVTRAKLDVVLASLSSRILGEHKFDKIEQKITVLYKKAHCIAVIPVFGTLVRRHSFLAAQSGLTSYQNLRAGFYKATRDEDVKGVLLEVDSGGGEAGGVFDLVTDLRTMAQKYQKPVFSLANEQACSAAYAIACIGQEIWATQTADLGSIGVVSAHVDQSKADEKAGLNWTYIYSGSNKVDANPHQPLSDDARSKIQANCDTLYQKFVELVASCRPLTANKIRATQAQIFMGEEALNIGLCDRIGTKMMALHALMKLINKNQHKEDNPKWQKTNTHEKNASKKTREKTKAIHTSMQKTMKTKMNSSKNLTKMKKS